MHRVCLICEVCVRVVGVLQCLYCMCMCVYVYLDLCVCVFICVCMWSIGISQQHVGVCAHPVG